MFLVPAGPFPAKATLSAGPDRAAGPAPVAARGAEDGGGAPEAASPAAAAKPPGGLGRAAAPVWPWVPVLVACIVAALAGWATGQAWKDLAGWPAAPIGRGIPPAGGTAPVHGTEPSGRDGASPAAAPASGPLGLLSQTVLAAEPAVHVVQKGETLYRIARRYGVSVDELARFNGLDDPAHIQAGQRLRIPPAGRGAGTAGEGVGRSVARTPASGVGGRPAAGTGTGSVPGSPASSGSQPDQDGGPSAPASAGRPAGGSGAGGGGDGAGSSGSGGVVALTFNDGPDPATWPALLQALDAAGVKATFFLEGARAQQFPQLVQELVRRGHQVENHGWSHRSPEELGEAATRAEIRRTAALLGRLAGRPPLYYRPAGALRDPAVFRWAREEGHRVLLWTNIGAPDVPPPPPDQLAARVAASAYNGGVLMLHATQPATVEALPQLLDRLAARGLQPVTVDRLLEILQAAGTASGAIAGAPEGDPAASGATGSPDPGGTGGAGSSGA